MRGFTLIELVIVLAIFLILFAIVGTLSSGTLPKTQLATESGFVQETLRRAQALTVAGKHDVAWGVFLTTSQMTLFGGDSYATRNVAYDEIHVFRSGITVSGLSEVVFSAPVGEPSVTGSVALVADATGETVSITINDAGRVSKE